MQVAGQTSAAQVTTVGTFKNILAKEGPRGLYNGLTAAFLRQFLYGSGRMGIYSYLLNDFKAKNKDAAPSLGTKLSFGLLSGGIGSFIGTPSEVAIVRMGADSQLPEAQRRNYKHVGDCVMRIAREEGIPKLWNGASVTVMRAMMMSTFQMGVYSETKERLQEASPGLFTSDSIITMFCSSMVASVFANLASLPFDVIKSRIQNMPIPVAGEAPLYTGMVDCVQKSVAKEGVTVLWKGFTPAFIKLAPYTTLSLTFLEWLTFAATGKAAL